MEKVAVQRASTEGRFVGACLLSGGALVVVSVLLLTPVGIVGDSDCGSVLVGGSTRSVCADPVSGRMLAIVAAGVVAAAFCALARRWTPIGSQASDVGVGFLTLLVGVVLAAMAIFGTVIGVSVIAGGNGWRGVLVLAACVAGVGGAATLLARSSRRSRNVPIPPVGSVMCGV